MGSRLRPGTWSDGLYALYDMTPEDQLSRTHPFYDRVHPQDLARVKSVIDRAAESGGAFTCDHRALLPGGYVRFIRSRGEVTTDETGTPVRMAGTARTSPRRSRPMTRSRVPRGRCPAARLIWIAFAAPRSSR